MKSFVRKAFDETRELVFTMSVKNTWSLSWYSGSISIGCLTKGLFTWELQRCVVTEWDNLHPALNWYKSSHFWSCLLKKWIKQENSDRIMLIITAYKVEWRSGAYKCNKNLHIVRFGKQYFEVFNKIGFEPSLKLLRNYSEFWKNFCKGVNFK